MKVIFLVICLIPCFLFSQEAFYGNGNFYIFPGATMGVFGDLGNDGTFQSTGGTVYFVGSSLQNVTGTSPVNINDLILNNSNNIKLDNQLEIIDLLTFTNGKIFSDRTDYSSQFVNFLSGATYSGVDNSHFVDGVVRKTGNTAFVFPVGQYTDLQPISIEAASALTDSYTTYYNYTDPLNDTYDPTIFQSGINNVSRCEYWILNPTSGSPDITFSLNFDINSCGITDPTDLIVVRWTGTEWENLGNGGTSGTVDDGILIKGVTCSGCGAFNPITMGSLTSLNPLPVELLNFNAVMNNRIVDLTWQTASEHNNDFFTVERSSDGFNFEPLTYVDGAGNSNGLLSYSTQDLNPFSGFSYYRLKQTDFDGVYEYSDIRVVNMDGNNDAVFFPNPSATDVMYITSNAAIKDLNIYAADGKLVFKQSEMGNSFALSLEPGVYFANYLINDKIQSKKIIFLDKN